MRIMVFDVAAESGGALTILNQYYHEAINDKNSKWIFVLSTPKLNESENVRVINFPWIKKSWVHRLYFDLFKAYKLVNKFDVDEIISLQNLLIPRTHVKQKLYLHQPLPFIEKRYGIHENFKFWTYQTIISKMILTSIKKADEVIVQTNWIMNAAIHKTGVNKEKFILEQPKINLIINRTYKQNVEKITFFYPASGLTYKNHVVIVLACKELKSKGIENYKVVFTLQGNENNNIRKLKEMILSEKFPIEFIGTIDIKQVYDFYSKSILIFPSYVETFGLPLLEAKMHKTPILASDCSFSHEILDEYEKVDFFDPFDFNNLSVLMARFLRKFSL